MQGFALFVVKTTGKRRITGRMPHRLAEGKTGTLRVRPASLRSKDFEGEANASSRRRRRSAPFGGCASVSRCAGFPRRAQGVKRPEHRFGDCLRGKQSFPSRRRRRSALCAARLRLSSSSQGIRPVRRRKTTTCDAFASRTTGTLSRPQRLRQEAKSAARPRSPRLCGLRCFAEVQLRATNRNTIYVITSISNAEKKSRFIVVRSKIGRVKSTNPNSIKI